MLSFIKKLIGIGLIWSCATMLSLLMWVAAIISIPHYVVELARISDLVSAKLIAVLTALVPSYGATLASLPAGKGLMYLAFFIPAYAIVRIIALVFRNDGRFN